jgi:bifunctional non-homologous end joining protein LigD
MSRGTPLRFIPPQLASSVNEPPEGKHWIHKIKHDGYRCQVLLERGRARVLTRTGLDWSEHYPSIVSAAANLDCQSAIFDGEAIVQDGNGVSDFEALRSAFVSKDSRRERQTSGCLLSDSLCAWISNSHSALSVLERN